MYVKWMKKSTLRNDIQTIVHPLSIRDDYHMEGSLDLAPAK